MVGWYHRHDGHEFQQNPGDMKDRETWCAAVHGVTNVRYDLVTEQEEEQGLTCGYEV